MDSLSFANNRSLEQPAAQLFQGEIVDLGDSPVYVAVGYTDNGLPKVAFNLSTNPFPIEATPSDRWTWASKPMEDRIAVAACEDEACARHLPGNPSAEYPCAIR